MPARPPAPCSRRRRQAAGSHRPLPKPAPRHPPGGRGRCHWWPPVKLHGCRPRTRPPPGLATHHLQAEAHAPGGRGRCRWRRPAPPACSSRRTSAASACPAWPAAPACGTHAGCERGHRVGCGAGSGAERRAGAGAPCRAAAQLAGRSPASLPAGEHACIPALLAACATRLHPVQLGEAVLVLRLALGAAQVLAARAAHACVAVAVAVAAAQRRPHQRLLALRRQVVGGERLWVVGSSDGGGWCLRGAGGSASASPHLDPRDGRHGRIGLRARHWLQSVRGRLTTLLALRRQAAAGWEMRLQVLRDYGAGEAGGAQPGGRRRRRRGTCSPRASPHLALDHRDFGLSTRASLGELRGVRRGLTTRCCHPLEANGWGPWGRAGAPGRLHKGTDSTRHQRSGCCGPCTKMGSGVGQHSLAALASRSPANPLLILFGGKVAQGPTASAASCPVTSRHQRRRPFAAAPAAASERPWVGAPAAHAPRKALQAHLVDRRPAAAAAAACRRRRRPPLASPLQQAAMSQQPPAAEPSLLDQGVQYVLRNKLKCVVTTWAAGLSGCMVSCARAGSHRARPACLPARLPPLWRATSGLPPVRPRTPRRRCPPFTGVRVDAAHARQPQDHPQPRVRAGADAGRAGRGGGHRDVRGRRQAGARARQARLLRTHLSFLLPAASCLLSSRQAALAGMVPSPRPPALRSRQAALA